MTEAKKQTKEEQIERLLPLAQAQVPALIGLAKAYNNAYPADSTSSEVLDAVTVAVPLRMFMVMASLTVNTLAIHKEKQAAAAADAHHEQRTAEIEAGKQEGA